MKTITAALPALILLTGHVLAQDPSRTFSYGNTEYGGSVTVAGHAAFQRSGLFGLSADLGGSLTKRVRMSGVEREALHYAGDLDATFGLRSLRPFAYGYGVAVGATVRVGGYTVFSRTHTDAREIGADLAPANVFGSGGIGDTIVVGPFSLNVRSQVRTSMDLSLRPSVAVVPPSVGLQLRGDAEVEGSASASVGAFGVTAGVRADLDFADPVITVDVRTDFTTINGSLAWSIESIHLFLQAFASGFGAEWVVTVLDRDFNGTRGSLPFGL